VASQIASFTARLDADEQRLGEINP